MFTGDLGGSPEDQGWSHNGYLPEEEFFGHQLVHTGFLTGAEDMDITRTGLMGCWLRQLSSFLIVGEGFCFVLFCFVLKNLDPDHTAVQANSRDCDQPRLVLRHFR